MKLLIEATFFNFKYITGIERHFFLQLELLEKTQLFEEIYLVVKNDIPKNLMNYRLKLKSIKIRNDTIESWKEIYANHEFNLIYSTFVPPPLFPEGKPMIYVLHDPGRYIYPEMMQKGALNEHMKLFENYAKQQQFYVITVSESSKKDIIKLFPELEKRIFVVYNFITKIFHELKEHNNFNRDFSSFIKGKYFLTVGRFMPTKNTLNIVKAFENRDSIFSDYKLVIIGRKGWYNELDDYLEKNKSDNIVILDYVSDEDLFCLYKNAYAFISASIYEGFGLPLIEANFCGCPRIFCSDIPVYREINVDGAIYFDPNNIYSLNKNIFTKEVEASLNFDEKISHFYFESVAGKFSDVLRGIING